MRVVRYAAQMCVKVNPYSVLVEIHEENVEGSGMEDTGLVGVEWIRMAQDGVQRQALVNTMRKVIWSFRRERDEICALMGCYAAQWRTEGVVWGGSSPPTKFWRFSKIVPNSTKKLLKIAEFRTPKPQDVRKKGSKILKLPPVRNCFTLVMTNKLVVIINSLKVPKIKKMLLYEI